MTDRNPDDPKLPPVPVGANENWIRIIDDRLKNIESNVADQQTKLARIERRLDAVISGLARRFFDGVAVGGLGLSVTVGALMDILSRAKFRRLGRSNPILLGAPRDQHVRCDYALVPGTANTLVWRRGTGIVVDQPSVIAVERANGARRVRAVGKEALAIQGETGIELIWPVRDGVIADDDAAGHMLRKILREAGFGRTSSHPPLALVVPMDVTNAERKLLAQSASAAGAGRLFLIDQPTSAAISNLLPVAEPFSSALVVIGAGRTEVAVFMLGTMVLSCSIRVSGTSMDRAIVSYVRRNHDLLISESTGERIKLAIGTALAPRDDIIVCIQGRDRISKKPREIFITQADIHEALSDCVATLVEHIRSTLENATPDVSADLIDQGILLAGGGALLPGIAELLSQETGMPVDIADEPMHCAALGAGDALDDQNLKCMFSEYSLR